MPSQPCPQERDAAPVLPIEQPEADGEEAVDVASKIGDMLVQNRKNLLGCVARNASQLGISPRHFLRVVRAVAEASVKHQRAILKNILDYAVMMERAGQYKADVFLHRVKYDETPLSLRTFYGLANRDTAYEHRARVFVVQESWTLFLSNCGAVTLPSPVGPGDSKHLILKGTMCPAVRCCQSGTGESIAEVLRSAMIIPDRASTSCKNVVRLVETDECAANMRAEKVLDHIEEEKQAKIHIICYAHKTHQIASSLWAECPEMHLGLVKILSLLKSPGMYERFVATFVAQLHTPDFLHITSAPLTPEAVAHRSMIMRLFMPRREDSPRSWAILQTLAERLFNGNWLIQGRLQHRCVAGCCVSRHDTINKLSRHIPRLLKLLRVQRLKTANWAAWHKQLFFVGFLLHFHGLFGKIFEIAFGGASARIAALEQPEGERRDEEGGDAQAETAKLVRLSLQWLRSSLPGPGTQIFILRAALEVQIHAMHKLLGSTRLENDLEAALCNVSGLLWAPIPFT